ncbi:hypothetical protein [Rhizobium sp. P44RR-XXIV]|uniref:hypothetical protein n=1 Tax=Rhizobium sp. P44RR-XXIV TaxID=1921145 RepID=UPI0010AAE5F0|nr:hypothetical protein [Rhizobium sp. P44RR-XXIV]TIX90709.1 hypothetical protein BSK43_015750 [Rhizobium sp. P44RR-XXIV]
MVGNNTIQLVGERGGAPRETASLAGILPSDLSQQDGRRARQWRKYNIYNDVTDRFAREGYDAA